ncbi:MAG: two-component sensor histidine kinase [Desulfobacteraceae bacterium]|nr:two-component sensor histidine kinase [Desulfobacteraceae bacterium]
MFKIKIAILSTLISGIILVCFGLFFMMVASKIGLAWIDRQMLTLGESQLHVWHTKEHWKKFDQSLDSIYGDEHWKDMVVQVTDADHEILYRSLHWPGEITVALFLEFDIKMEADAKRRNLPKDPSEPPHGSANRKSSAFGDVPAEDTIQPPPRLNEPQRPPPPSRARPMHSPPYIKKSFFKTVQTQSGSWRTGIMGNQHHTIVVGINMARFYEFASKFKKLFLLSVIVALLLMAGAGYLIANRAMKPISLITRTAEKITARGLGRRIIDGGADAELLRLIYVLNDMLDRLEKSFNQAVRFSADAAHELQTPLTILQGVLDDAVQSTAYGTDEQRRYSSLLEEVQRLKSIVQKLLILARADADQLPLQLQLVNMSAMIASAVEDAGVIGPDLVIEKDILPGIYVQADPGLLGLAIQGLTANAVQYNTDKGLIRFRLTVQNRNALFTISNTGTLIPEQERKLIFDRFYQIGKSRSHRIPGTGLGLSLAQEIMRAHDGSLKFEVTKDNLNAFTVSLACHSHS